MNFSYNLHPKTQFFLAASFVLVGIVALVWFAFFFLLDWVQSESVEIEAAKIRRASIELRRNSAKREEAALEELHTEVGRIEGVFVEYPLIFFEFLENLALRDNLVISLALEGQIAEKKPERLRVTASGVYRNLLRFVRGVELSPYATDIRGITLQMTDQRPLFSNSLARFVIDLQIISK